MLNKLAPDLMNKIAQSESYNSLFMPVYEKNIAWVEIKVHRIPLSVLNFTLPSGSVIKS
jgi:hypothetical protein